MGLNWLEKTSVLDVFFLLVPSLRGRAPGPEKRRTLSSGRTYRAGHRGAVLTGPQGIAIDSPRRGNVGQTKVGSS
ncbi:hypothetical protein NDU88_005596 [Pleurodeles waltl]|uniref:Uncharacterized protein n=1 Tax=Pleurodeles waltl TaxID=8319 RepID=A0AAV7X140_PLEWA|nr:hypothetical protein NDU88_005596 [Pleurodeles waltl]